MSSYNYREAVWHKKGKLSVRWLSDSGKFHEMTLRDPTANKTEWLAQARLRLKEITQGNPEFTAEYKDS